MSHTDKKIWRFRIVRAEKGKHDKISLPLEEGNLITKKKKLLYLLKYAKTSWCPICVLSGFETRTSNNFFITVRACYIHWNIFKRRFFLWRFRTCRRLRWFIAFSFFMRHQMHSLLIRHVRSTGRKLCFSGERSLLNTRQNVDPQVCVTYVLNPNCYFKQQDVSPMLSYSLFARFGWGFYWPR